MLRRALLAATALTAALAGTATMGPPAAAVDVECPIEIGDGCGGGGDGGGGGGGGGAPSYVLQGVIQVEGYTNAPNGQPGRRVEIRGYSRLANASNDRVDADYINVRCNAYDFNGYTTDYDSENGGALVDVHFASNWVYGVGPTYRTITVSCTHHATKYGVDYDTTSTRQIVIPE
ncbi:hypothetical protein [Streptomyces sp. NPDC003717]|uniref:hypothetical protein n=1 Tax=Streptomyces sp. NPDC003717 TaxID=3154276 RepID=UPI0033B39B05